MTDFGFKIHKDQLLDQDRTNHAYKEMIERVPSLSLCISCGSCTATCNSSEMTGMGFRKLHLYLRTGLYVNLKRGLKYCQYCGKCWLVCPRGVNTRKAIVEMKRIFEIYKT